jgi:hypothetical protein
MAEFEVVIKQVRTPALEQILRAQPKLRNSLVTIQQGSRKIQAIRTPFGPLVGGQFVGGPLAAFLNTTFLKAWEQTLVQVNEDMVRRVVERQMDAIEIDDNISRILTKFPEALIKSTEEEILKVFDELERVGKFLLNSDDPQAGRWWTKEHGRRRNQRETGKLFGDRNVVYGRIVRAGDFQGFVWPDPQKLSKAKHWRFVEFGDEVPREMSAGWLAPKGGGIGGHKTSTRFYPYKGGEPTRRTKGGETKRIPALWVGPRVGHAGHGPVGKPEPLMVRSKPKALFARTAAQVFGLQGDKLTEKFGASTSRLLDSLHEKLQESGK